MHHLFFLRAQHTSVEELIDLIAHLHLKSISQGTKLLAETEKLECSTSNEKVVVQIEK